MELFLRFLLFLTKVCGFFAMPIILLVNKYSIKSTTITPSTNKWLNMPAIDLAEKIRSQEVTSEEVVIAFITRIKEVDTILNAVVGNRFDEALLEARRADSMVKATSPLYLLTEYPLLGVPFTVKESCAIKGLPLVVGSLKRQGMIAEKDGSAVGYLRSAGAIPLVVTNTPEYCYNWESDNFVYGRSLNPFNTQRSPGGSSGGEGALIGSGSSVFGVGSDVAGSIRVPAMFNGIFGHKPTAGLVSLEGHFPYANDKLFHQYLVIGPMARYAKDLPTLLSIMSGYNAKKLNLDQELFTKDIKIFYMEDAGFSFADISVADDIKIAMYKAIKHFENNGLEVKEAPFKTLQETLEMSLANLFSIKDIPNIFDNIDGTMPNNNLYLELLKCAIRQSKFTLPALVFMLLIRQKGFLPKRKIDFYVKQSERLKDELLNLLGTNGVLFYPTYPMSALYHNESPFSMFATIYSMVFNWLGFPSTHVPLGKDSNGMPIGIQIAAAPLQDRLCFCIAGELEAAFGGWKL